MGICWSTFLFYFILPMFSRIQNTTLSSYYVLDALGSSRVTAIHWVLASRKLTVYLGSQKACFAVSHTWLPPLSRHTGGTFSVLLLPSAVDSNLSHCLSSFESLAPKQVCYFFFPSWSKPCSLFLRHILKCYILSSFWVRGKPFRQGWE